MTVRLLEKEVLELPVRSRVRLAEKIIGSIDGYATPEIEAAWNNEVERRVEEIRSGVEKGIPASRVMKDARRALSEARRLSSTRRK
jgi:putative addiction module component (TIGR02574 family)